MKKIFILFFLALLIVPVPVSAIDLGLGRARSAAVDGGFSANTNETTLSETIGGIVKAALSFIGVIFTSLMVYAGFLWMTASGEEDKIKKAQNIIRGAVIGLVLTLGAYSITAFVVPKVLERTAGKTKQNSGGGGAASGSTGSAAAQGGCVWAPGIGSGVPSGGGSSTEPTGATECRTWCRTASGLLARANGRASIPHSCTYNGTRQY